MSEFPYAETQLTSAAAHGQLEKIQQLLDYGTNVNCSEGDPLIEAAENGQLETVKLLLNCNADPTLTGSMGCGKAADYALNFNHPMIYALLDPEGARAKAEERTAAAFDPEQRPETQSHNGSRGRE